MTSFKRTIEDFTCENCQAQVEGDGYTNHCPECLWSKHVDIEPGDRAASCSCLMEPISYEKEGEGISVTHKCVGCGHIKKNKISKDDDFDKVVNLQ